MKRISIKTNKRVEALEITSQIRQAVRAAGWKNGVLFAFCPHTTCALFTNEYESYIKSDFEKFFSELEKQEWRHNEVDGNAVAHLRNAALGGQQFFFVENGGLVLGTWQHIVLFEGDGPRERELWLDFIEKK